MKKAIQTGIILLITISTIALCDTFKHKETGETFTGFKTQKSNGGKTLVYNSEEKKLTAVALNEYDITYNTEGRRDTVFIVPITKSEILLSQVVSETIAKSIVEASNAGPQAIILQIDNPGGRGEYMKTIVSAVIDTKNCPVVAYISGGEYGGAFSAAAVIALACEKIYIAPTAGIGAVGPLVGVTEEDFQDYLSTYCPDSLASYSIFVKSIAETNHYPGLLARGLVDRQLSIYQVLNSDGSKDFVDNRLPNQTLINTLAQGKAILEGTDTGSPAPLRPADVINSVLTLSPTKAVEYGLAHQIADSIKAITADLGIPEAQPITAPGIEKTVKEYTAARRNLSQVLYQIEYIENQAKQLEENISQVEQNVITGTQTRQVDQGTPSSSYYRRSSNRSFPVDYGSYYYDPTLSSRNTRYSRTNRSARDTVGQSVITQQPNVNINVLYDELSRQLTQLESQYRKAISLGRRWPGALPPNLPVSALESDLDLVRAQYDAIQRYRSQIQIQGVQTNPVNTGRNTRRYR